MSGDGCDKNPEFLSCSQYMADDELELELELSSEPDSLPLVGSVEMEGAAVNEVEDISSSIIRHGGVDPSLTDEVIDSMTEPDDINNKVVEATTTTMDDDDAILKIHEAVAGSLVGYLIESEEGKDVVGVEGYDFIVEDSFPDESEEKCSKERTRMIIDPDDYSNFIVKDSMSDESDGDVKEDASRFPDFIVEDSLPDDSEGDTDFKDVPVAAANKDVKGVATAAASNLADTAVGECDDGLTAEGSLQDQSEGSKDVSAAARKDVKEVATAAANNEADTAVGECDGLAVEGSLPDEPEENKDVPAAANKDVEGVATAAANNETADNAIGECDGLTVEGSLPDEPEDYSYDPGSDFEELFDDPLVNINMTENTELWAVHLSLDGLPLGLHNQKLTLDLDQMIMGEVVDSFGIVHQLVDDRMPMAPCYIFQPSPSGTKFVGKISRHISLVSYPEVDQLRQWRQVAAESNKSRKKKMKIKYKLYNSKKVGRSNNKSNTFEGNLIIPKDKEADAGGNWFSDCQ